MAGLTAERSLKSWLNRAHGKNALLIQHRRNFAHVQTAVGFNLDHSNLDYSNLDHSIHGPDSNLILDGNSTQRNNLGSQTRIDLV
ncbi:hypothetical protein [Leptolyngbya sp. CCY15150]|uniref:hypothetical protein n=1 Tax=Leptolyngbya sp. CCY15150 TaxID=2767772 RepID=UPI00194F5B93|nr:hypothetical protein [Leptolyngbya sp. CCY15150]